MKVHNPFDRLTKTEGEAKLQYWSENYRRQFNGNVYHYTNAAALGGILSSRKIYCSDYRQLNDTTELSMGLEVLEAAIASRGEATGASAENVQNILDHLALLRRASFHMSMYAASFSFHGNDLTQWRAYAPSHGVSIGFKLSVLQQLAADQHFVHGPVRYLGAPRFNEWLDAQLAAMKDGLEESAANEARLREASSDQPPELVEMSILFQRSGNLERWIGEVSGLLKNADFRSEAEWRFVFVHRLNTKQPQKPALFRTSGARVVRYVELDLAKADINELIPEVIIGPGAAGDETFQVVADLLRSNGANASVSRPLHAVR